MSYRFPILLYHRVGPRDGSYMDAYTVSPEAFLAQMEQIHREGWCPVSITSALEGDIPKHSRGLLAITFDDGFASNREHAWPVLERFGFPSDSFVVTDRLGQSNTWDGPENGTWPLLSKEDLEGANHQTMTFHSHSVTHPLLPAKLRREGCLAKELRRSTMNLAESRINWGNGFAYPFGAWSRGVVEEVRSAGYGWACTCMEGLIRRAKTLSCSDA